MKVGWNQYNYVSTSWYRKMVSFGCHVSAILKKEGRLRTFV